MRPYHSVTLSSLTLYAAIVTIHVQNVFAFPIWNFMPINDNSPFPSPRTCLPQFSFLCLWRWLLWVLYIRGLIDYLSFWDWFTSLSTMSLKFIQVAACARVAFIARTNNIHVYTHQMLIHSSINDTWEAFLFGLLWIMSLWSRVYKHLLDICFCFFWVYTQKRNC